MSAYQPQAADPTAVVGRRVGAFIVDMIIAQLFYWPFFFLLADSADADLATCSGTCLTLNDTVYGVGGGTSILLNLISIAYTVLVFVLLQGFKGITPGKLLFGIRTVNGEGQPPGPIRALIRHLLLIVDLIPYCIPGLLGLILMITQNNHQRVGDKAAKTFVVGKNDMGRPIPGADGGLPAAAPVGAGAPAGPYAAAAPAATPAAAPPGGQPAAPAGTEAQWDPARNAYIQWDPNQQQWLQFDDATQQWRPIDQ